MSNLTTGATSLAQYEAAKRSAALQGGATPVSPNVQPPPTVTAATVQAEQGAAQAQPQAEAFTVTALDVSPNPTTREVVVGLSKAMSDPTLNATTQAGLWKLHDMLTQAEKAMTQVIVDGMLI